MCCAPGPRRYAASPSESTPLSRSVLQADSDSTACRCQRRGNTRAGWTAGRPQPYALAIPNHKLNWRGRRFIDSESPRLAARPTTLLQEKNVRLGHTLERSNFHRWRVAVKRNQKPRYKFWSHGKLCALFSNNFLRVKEDDTPGCYMRPGPDTRRSGRGSSP